MVMVVLALTEAQAPDAGTVLVMVYTPGLVKLRSISPGVLETK